MTTALLVYTLVFVTAFAVALPLYLRAESRVLEAPGGFKKACALKVTTSGLCALCALLGFLLWGIPSGLIGALIPVALICSAIGDYFLQFIVLDEKKFKTGILFFALTQVFLVTFLCLRHGISWPEFVITALVGIGVWALVTRQKWELGGAKIPLFCYIALLLFMMSKSVLALFGSAGITLPLALMAAGAVLFVVSDSLLGLKYFAGGRQSQQTPQSSSKLYLITYFCAILLIALSSLFY